MIRKGNKAQKQEKTLANLNIIFNGRNNAINFIEEYVSLILEAKKRAAEEQTEQDGTGLKILTPKQLLQRLPIALTQVKAGNNSGKFVKSNQTNHLFFVLIKINH